MSSGRDFLNLDEQANNQPSESSPYDYLAQFNQPKESYEKSLAMAIPRIGTDIASSLYNAAQNIPEYFQKGKSEVPGLMKNFFLHPISAAQQELAGLAEAGQKAFNTPHDIANYATNRLNLIPEDINQKIQMARMPESQEAINQTFGKPQHPGEELLRGGLRNIESLIPAGAVVQKLNPMNLTARSVADSIANEGAKQIHLHNNMYNRIWDVADRRGINTVPFNNRTMNHNLEFIERYKAPKETESVNRFMTHPTLNNAQIAQADMGKIRRQLEEASRKRALTGEERLMLDSATNLENEIQNNMFRDRQGNVHQDLLNEYNRVSNSYRRNVVPYRYNEAINDYMQGNKTAKKLIQNLKSGEEFEAQKGAAHPELYRSEGLKKTLMALIAGGGLYGSYKGYNDISQYLTGSAE